MDLVGGTGSAPVIDRDGRPLRALNQYDTDAAREAASPAGPGPGGRGGAGPVPGGRPRLTDRRAVRLVLAAVVPLLIVAVWQWVSVTGLVASYLLPAPAAVWRAGVDLVERGELGMHVAISVQRVFIGFAIGAVLGLLAGAVVGLSRLGDVLLSSTLGAVRAVPSLAWVPLLILWMKIGEDSKITLIAIGAFFPVYTTVAAALRHVDHHLVEVGRAYGLRGASLFSTVQLPAVLPSVVSGLRLAMAQAWLFLVAAELIASSMGLGFLLMDSQNNGRTDRMLLAIALLAVLGKITDSLIGLAEKRLLRRWA
ncbi:ABC transporter permease [Cellulomonas sp. ATA003]|uniref:ABC transporter permease n=1 Tax=Cellulomonas sp. ATA003 TaxID=3073064 RepID=UPI00287389E9|nr:ABC transporter permease [Cellulomonas sp. ATA003]WNB86754.1 ABC transporter permease [Cellulomonas sp. ATA003]